MQQGQSQRETPGRGLGEPRRCKRGSSQWEETRIVGASRKRQPCQHLDVSPGTLTSDTHFIPDGKRRSWCRSVKTVAGYTLTPTNRQLPPHKRSREKNTSLTIRPTNDLETHPARNAQDRHKKATTPRRGLSRQKTTGTVGRPSSQKHLLPDLTCTLLLMVSTQTSLSPSWLAATRPRPILPLLGRSPNV